MEVLLANGRIIMTTGKSNALKTKDNKNGAWIYFSPDGDILKKEIYRLDSLNN